MAKNNMCCSKTAKGQNCSFLGSFEYNGNYYCKKHLRVLKSKEECCICFCNMDDKKDNIELNCGHFFHIRCLSQCQKAICPLCRVQFVPMESYRIFKSTVVKPIAHSIFAFNSNNHGILFGMIRSLINISSKGQWYMETIFAIICSFESFTKHPEKRDDFVRNLQDFILQLQSGY